MRRISDAIKEGSEGFLNVQYGTIAQIAVFVAMAIFGIYLYREPPSENIGTFMLAVITAASFLLGAFCSALAG